MKSRSSSDRSPRARNSMATAPASHSPSWRGAYFYAQHRPPTLVRFPSRRWHSMATDDFSRSAGIARSSSTAPKAAPRSASAIFPNASPHLRGA
jgi:hypothetical protein